jgi:hypothetical protein
MAAAMRHVRDPVPGVRALRPDVPERVDAVVARAMAKRPEDRFGSMGELADALESCLADIKGARGERPDEDTGVVPPPAAAARTEALRAPPPTKVAAARRSGLRVAAILLVAAVVLVGSLFALEIAFEDGLPWTGGDPTPVQIQAIADFDPDGDLTEHPEAVAAATDRDTATFWTTEEYRSFDKEGVGILLDAGSPVALSSIVLVTDTPGFTAMILADDQRGGRFVDVSGEQEVGRRTTFDVDTRGEALRYYVVWITDPNTSAHVNEVRAFVSR